MRPLMEEDKETSIPYRSNKHESPLYVKLVRVNHVFAPRKSIVRQFRGVVFLSCQDWIQNRPDFSGRHV